MLSREILSEEHAELDALAVKLLDHLATSTAPDHTLSALRWRLNRVLMLHLAKEDKLLYPALARSTVPTTRLLATRFAQEMGGLSAQYLAYANDWTHDRATNDWSGFVRETREVMRALRTRIRREERDLYPRIDVAA